MTEITLDDLPIKLMRESHYSKSSQRIANAFLELLEKQFPVKNKYPLQLRYASHFADKLNIHVNHLNRAVKGILNMTTTQVIAERILKEAKILLEKSSLSVSDIGYVLGFSETTHFINFFKKQTHVSPKKFRLE